MESLPLKAALGFVADSFALVIIRQGFEGINL